MYWLLLFILALVVALVFLQYWVLKRRQSNWSRIDQKFCKENWIRINKMNDPRHQVVEADKLLDYMMRKRGYQGSVADMLKEHGKQFSNLDRLWQAHKLRNKIAHELDYSISSTVAHGALMSFKRALKDMGLNI